MNDVQNEFVVVVVVVVVVIGIGIVIGMYNSMRTCSYPSTDTTTQRTRHTVVVVDWINTFDENHVVCDCGRIVWTLRCLRCVG